MTKDWKKKIDEWMKPKKSVEAIETKAVAKIERCHIWYCFKSAPSSWSEGSSHMEGFPPNDHEVIDEPSIHFGLEYCKHCSKPTCEDHIHRGICMYCVKNLR